jgi:hypothetical protein
MRRIYLFALIHILVSFTALAQNKFISVGSGGGFVGTATVYKVTPNGKVFKGTGVGDIKFSLCGKIKKAKAKQIVTRVADQLDSATSFNHPGNLFYFISYTEDNNERTITWGDADHPIQADVKKLYEEVLASVNGVRFKPIK